MGLFDKLFGKKEEENARDSSKITIANLEIGDIVDYFLKSWEVKDVYEYDWGNNDYTHEYKLSAGDEIFYLHVDRDDEIELCKSTKIKVTDVNPLLPNMIIEADEPPATLDYDGKTFFRKEEAQGHFKSVTDDEDDWEAFVSWDYVDTIGNKILTIERWGEQEFEASIGEYLQPYEFSNIIPKQ